MTGEWVLTMTCLNELPVSVKSVVNFFSNLAMSFTLKG